MSEHTPETDPDEYDPDTSPAVRKAMDAVWDHVEALNTDQGSLLIEECLYRICLGIEALAEKHGGSPDIAAMGTLAQVAGRVVALERGKAGFKDRQDAKVSMTFRLIHNLMETYITDSMPEEVQQKVKSFEAAVQARMQAGEGDIETVVAEEAAKVGLEHQIVHANGDHDHHVHQTHSKRPPLDPRVEKDLGAAYM